MGLSITVGIMDDLADDEEGLEQERQRFEELNAFLRAADREVHIEPEVAEPSFSADMEGYVTLHYCRRAAASLWKTGRVAPMGNGDPVEDPAYREYYAQAAQSPIGDGPMRWVGSPKSNGRSFDHLMFHSDSEGVYLPTTLEQVLEIDQGDGVELIGSVARLLSECKEVVRALSIPSEVLLDLDAAYEGLESPQLWGGFGREALGFAVLMGACRASNRSGAALIFH